MIYSGETLTALQALSLWNNRFTLAMAREFADRLEKEEQALPDQVGRAMLLTVQREISPSERDQLVAYARSHGLAQLCRLLFNLNEFVYLD